MGRGARGKEKENENSKSKSNKEQEALLLQNACSSPSSFMSMHMFMHTNMQHCK
jgi:hypothetical protein